VYDLASLYDTEYTQAYLKLEAEGKYVRQVDPIKLWTLLYEVNKESGTPYICFSDAVNRSSMHKHIGTIRSSNLCSEITLYSDADEYAVCNLASINLQSCVDDIACNYDFKKLARITAICVRNLNNIIDKNYYPVEQTRRSNMRHRPIGIGVQGLADTFLRLRYPFESPEAMALNKLIFETIYYASLCESAKICRESYLELVREAKARGEDHTRIRTDHFAFPSINENGGSPIKNGIFHFEMCANKSVSGRYDWESLREMIKIYGVANSFLVALMPTASTSQLLGNNECFEPYTSNLYKRTTLAGEFLVLNKFFVADAHRLGIWNKELVDHIIALDGSIQSIEGIPAEIKALYKTAYEIDPFVVLQQAIDRQPFVDQAQSLNWHIQDLSIGLFNKLTFYAWRGGLKTAKYYLRTKPEVTAQKFVIDHALQERARAVLDSEKREVREEVRDPEDEKICLVCSS
jgi:ribonucleoside-diphosphate reductase alpha chain